MDQPAHEPAEGPDDPRFLEAVYEALRALAARRLAMERPGQTLQATALVHEAWLKIGAGHGPDWRSRSHFYAAAAEAMRRILIDNARRKRALRHGGGWLRIESPELDKLCGSAADSAERVEALQAAIGKLAALDAAKAELVKLRYYVGLTIEEASALMGISTPTAKRYWSFARAWLFRELQADATPQGSLISLGSRRPSPPAAP